MKVRIEVDGRVLDVAPFVNDMVASVVQGLITPLRGVYMPKKAVIEVEFGEERETAP